MTSMSLFFLCLATKERKVTKKKKVPIADDVNGYFYCLSLIYMQKLPFI